MVPTIHCVTLGCIPGRFSPTVYGSNEESKFVQTRWMLSLFLFCFVFAFTHSQGEKGRNIQKLMTQPGWVIEWMKQASLGAWGFTRKV